MQLAEKIAKEAEDRGYEYWLKQVYPVYWEDTFHGCDIQVEIVLHEKNDRYIQLGVAVDDIYQAKNPVAYSAVVHRRHRPPSVR